MGSPVQERRGMSSVKVHKADEEVGAFVIQGEAERAGAF